MNFHNPLEGSILKKYPDGNVRQWFGENPVLYKNAIGLSGHNGIDISLPMPCNVLSATDGVVFDVKDSPNGYGKHVRVLSEKDGNVYYETTYGHLEMVFVKNGDKVVAGQQLGLEGNTGFVISGGTQYWGNAPANKGVHLHFGLRLLTDENQQWMTNINGQTKYVLNYDNGYNGCIDPFPYLKHLIDYSGAMEYIEKNENKLVQNVATGSIGIIKGDKILETTAERAGLLALTTLIRNGFGGAVPPELWEQFPKDKF